MMEQQQNKVQCNNNNNKQQHAYLKYAIVFCISGSEAGPVPQYVSLQGLLDPPPCMQQEVASCTTQQSPSLTSPHL